MTPLRSAGFRLRCIAWTIDGTLLGLMALIATWQRTAPAARAWVIRAESLLVDAGQSLGDAVIGGTRPERQLATMLYYDPQLADAVAAINAAGWALVWPVIAAFALLGALYHPIAERSRWHGSLGKRLLGLRVVDLRGRPISAGRGLVRHAAASLSWATFNLGHLLAALAPHHLALHDRSSGTRVVATAGPAPRWVNAWLVVLVAAGLTASIWLTNHAVAVLQRGLEATLG